MKINAVTERLKGSADTCDFAYDSVYDLLLKVFLKLIYDFFG
jgi:hypothetical protein